MPEMIFIFLLALLLFGPKKLPQVGRELGKALTEFKRASNEFKNQLETEIEMAEAQEKNKGIQPPPEPSLAQADSSVAVPADGVTAVDPHTSAPAADGVTGIAAEPKILPPSEPTVASSFGQPVSPADPVAPAGIQAGTAPSGLPAEHAQLSLLPESPKAGEARPATGGHSQPAQAATQTVAAASAAAPHAAETGVLEKASLRDTTA